MDKNIREKVIFRIRELDNILSNIEQIKSERKKLSELLEFYKDKKLISSPRKSKASKSKSGGRKSNKGIGENIKKIATSLIKKKGSSVSTVEIVDNLLKDRKDLDRKYAYIHTYNVLSKSKSEFKKDGKDWSLKG